MHIRLCFFSFRWREYINNPNKRGLEDKRNDGLAIAGELVAKSLFVPCVTVGGSRCHEADEDEGKDERWGGEGGGDGVFCAEVGKDGERVKSGKSE